MPNRLLINSRKTAIIIVVLVTLLAGSIFLLRQGRRSKATPGVPTLFYSTEPGSLQSGQNFDLVLKINPNGATLYAFELYTIYDPQKVDFQNTTILAQNISSQFILINSTVDTANNIISITGAKTGSAFPSSSNTEIARVKMKVKSGVLGDVGFSWGGNTKVGSNLNKELLDGLFTISEVTIQPTSTPGQPAGPDLHLDIPTLPRVGGSGIAQRGANVDVQVFLKTNNIPVKAVDFILPYDDSMLTFQNTADLVANIELDPNSGFNTQFVIKKVDVVAKKIIFSLVVPVVNQQPIPVSSPNDIILGIIKFKVRTDAPDGQVSLLPDTTSTIYDLQTQNILTCTGGIRFNVGVLTATDTPIPTSPPFITDTPWPTFPPPPTNTPFIILPTSVPTITNPPVGVAMALDFKFRFQGILAKPNRLNSIPVKITVKSSAASANTIKSVSANVTVDASGIWSGQAYFPSLLEAPDYIILVKGPMHLQKRICENSPSETEPAKYSCISGNIQLLAGTNLLDFNQINLIAGDLPQQDGVANAYDVALTRNNLGSTDPAILAIADVNFDGIVDTQDYSLVIEALAIRTDDEL